MTAGHSNLKQLTVIMHVLTKRLHFLEEKKRLGFSENAHFEPLDLSDHHQNLYTCSEREYCIPTNFHRDRITPAQFFKGFAFFVCYTCVTPVLHFRCNTGVTQGVTQV